MSFSAFTPATNNGTMLGRSPDDIIEMFGVPESASMGTQTLKFFYTDPTNKDVCFTFHDDVAISVPAEGFTPLNITRPPEGKLYNGQSVRSAALRVGNADSIHIGSRSVTATYEDGTKATVAMGRVFPHTP